MANDAKKRLLEKAMTVFAVKGYADTSTREIARAAKVNISAIAYYFGGKQGLYQSVLGDIVHRTRSAIENEVESAVAVLTDEKSTPEQVEEVLYTLFRALARLLYADALPTAAVTIFLHEYGNPGESFVTLQQGLITPYYKITADLIVKATGGTPVKEVKDEILLYSFPLFAGLFAFKTRKHMVLKLMNWKEYGSQEIDRIVNLIIQLTRAVVSSCKNKTK